MSYSVFDQVGMDLLYQWAGGPPHSLLHLSVHSWSLPQRAALQHLRATLNRATAQHLSLVSNANTVTFLDVAKQVRNKLCKWSAKATESAFRKIIITEILYSSSRLFQGEYEM